jgi:stress response protein YsnF
MENEDHMANTSRDVTKSAFPMLDMMLGMQQMGMKALSIYQPFAVSFWDSSKTADRKAEAVGYGLMNRRGSEAGETISGSSEQVVAIGEEVLNVGTRVMPGRTTRIRRVVVESPVQQDVTLHTETVVVERRAPMTSIGQDVLTEVTVEMSDTNEVPVISKSVHLVEEVLLRKEVTARTETIRDTVRRDKLEIEDQSQLPVVFSNNTPKTEEKRRDEKRNAEMQERRRNVAAMQADSKTGE